MIITKGPHGIFVLCNVIAVTVLTTMLWKRIKNSGPQFWLREEFLWKQTEQIQKCDIRRGFKMDTIWPPLPTLRRHGVGR